MSDDGDMMSDDGDMMSDEQEIVWDELTLCYENNIDLDDGARRMAVFSTLRNSCLDVDEQKDLINKMGWPWDYEVISDDLDGEDFYIPDDFSSWWEEINNEFNNDEFSCNEEWDDE